MMAVAMGDPGEAGWLRETMRGLLLKGQRKVHWHDESSDRRVKLVDAIADMPVEGFVVVRTAGQGDRLERRRRKCLELLLRELDGFGCDRLILESRGSADDRRDRAVLEYLRRRREITAPLRLFHEPGPNDPMLWIPDVICGAVGQARAGEFRYFDRIASRVTIRVVERDVLT